MTTLRYFYVFAVCFNLVSGAYSLLEGRPGPALGSLSVALLLLVLRPAEDAK